MMSTIAGSMMSVVGVTFSIILVVLALASSQYTSRILRNFMRSRVTQVVLGIFAGIFTYCLIVLRTIRAVSYTHLRAHETDSYLVCRLLLEKKKIKKKKLQYTLNNKY